MLDEPRPGAPRKITDEHVEHAVRLTLENTPRDAADWHGPALRVEQTAASRIWRAFALQPY